MRGRVAKAPIGRYAYPKRLANGKQVTCEVEVFPLEAAEDALDRLRSGRIRGAAVLDITP